MTTETKMNKKQRLFNQQSKEKLDYWLSKMAKLDGALHLKPDYLRPDDYVAGKGKITIEAPAESLITLQKITNHSPLLVYTCLITSVAICLYKYCGNDVIPIGSPNRLKDEAPDCEPNALPVVITIRPDYKVRELLTSVRRILIEDYVRQDQPCETLIDKLGLQGVVNRCPLFDIGVALTGFTQAMPELKNDLTISFTLSGGKLSGTFDYNASLFARESIARVSRHLLSILEQMLSNTDALIAELDLLTGEEREKVLAASRVTSESKAPERLVPDVILEWYDRTPDAVALVWKASSLTYGELARGVYKQARYLQEHGVSADILVGIQFDRSIETMVNVLGVLAAGGAYVPIDPEYPAGVLEKMLNIAQPVILLTPGKTSPLPFHFDSICRQPLPLLLPENLAYMIYTSGSTGQPKGVQVTHRGLANLQKSQLQTFGVTSGDRVLQFASLSFDASIFEIVMALSNGATLVLLDQEALPLGDQLYEFIQDYGITNVTLPPSVLKGIRPEKLSGLRTIISAGEECPAELVERWGDRLFNAYGPTETTVWATCARGTTAIGRTITNVSGYILGRDLELLPLGVEGELCLGGEGLARGYLNRPEQTAERFVPHPYASEEGSLLYRTGDLARYRSDGEIEFLGRIDRQVKVRGYRIETGEIEAVLKQDGRIKDSIVITRKDAEGDNRLIAYVTTREKVSAEELRVGLEAKLPRYMIPANLVILEKIPLTANGKIDRKTLPDPEISNERRGEERPRSAIEEILEGIWCDVLKLEQVGVGENFFELGGHSLLATQVMSRLKKAMRVELPLRIMFEKPTITGLADAVGRARRANHCSETPLIRSVSRGGDLPLSYAQQRLWFVHQLEPENIAYNIPCSVRIGGELNIAALCQTLHEVVRRHEVLRTRFVSQGGHPIQIIDDPGDINVCFWDVSDMGGVEKGPHTLSIKGQYSRRPFDLAHQPVWRAALVRLGSQDHILIWCMHHVASDGWSTSVLVREFNVLYDIYRMGTPSTLPELPVQYADFAVWQRQRLQGEILQEQLDYWKDKLTGVQVLELPTDRPRPVVFNNSGARLSFALSKELTQNLKALSRKAEVTLFMTLIAGLKLLFANFTGQEDIAIGTVIAGRNLEETQGLIGFFVNRLILRTDLSGNPTVQELLGRVRETALGAYEHQDLPYQLLVEELQPERNLSNQIFTPVMVAFQNIPEMPSFSSNIITESKTIDEDIVDFDMTIFLNEKDGQVNGSLLYAKDLYERETIAELLGRLQRVLEMMVTYGMRAS